MLRASSLGLKLPPALGYTLPPCLALRIRGSLTFVHTWSELAFRRAPEPRSAESRYSTPESVHAENTFDVKVESGSNDNDGENQNKTDPSGPTAKPHRPRRRAIIRPLCPPIVPWIPDNSDTSCDASAPATYVSIGEAGTNDARIASLRRGIAHHSEDAITFWNKTSVPIQTDRVRRIRLRQGSLRNKYLDVIAKTDSSAAAMDAYNRIRCLPTDEYLLGEEPQIPFSHLHRMARLVISVKPRTRDQFLQLLSIASTIRKTGGTVHLWEWNALMDCAGKGSRKTRLADYRRSLAIFDDMMSQNAPENADSGSEGDGSDEDGLFDSEEAKRLKPDIYTYTTLLNIAGRTFDAKALRHAMGLFRSGKMPPNRITHLVLLRYFTHKNDTSAIRFTIDLMKEQNLELDISAINSFVWAYARNGRMDVAWNIYRVLRHAVVHDGQEAQQGVDVAKQNLAREGIVIPEGMIPDRVTYHSLVQAFAYRGDIVRSLQLFVDMLTTPNTEDGESESECAPYPPTLTAFRAIFHGFARHGRPSNYNGAISFVAQLHPKAAHPFSADSTWNLENLQLMFDNFLQLPSDVKPSDRTIWWILIAFARTSNADVHKLREVWFQLKDRYTGSWSERVRRFGAIVSEDWSRQRSQDALLNLIRNSL